MNTIKKSLVLLAVVACLTGCKNKDKDSSNEYFYLPSHITDFNSADNEINCESYFEYDDDFLGYTETRFIKYSSAPKNVTTYRFNEDFSKLTVVDNDYKLEGENYVLDSGERNEYQFLENSSYIQVTYEYDLDENDYVFWHEKGYFYNEMGLKTLEYNKLYDNNKKAYYYDSYNVYSYDEKGYPLSTLFYEAYYDEDNRVLYAKDEYIYENNERKKCAMHSYYDNDGVLKEEDWTEINIETKDGIIYFDEQIHYDGYDGNHNKFGYRSDWKKVYSYYGGMDSGSSIKYNDFDQIYYYESVSGDFINTMDVTYKENGGHILSSSEKTTIEGKLASSNTTVYSYNEFNQMSKVRLDGLMVNPGETPENFEFYEETTIEYSTLQNKNLFNHLDCFNDLISSYSSYFLIEGI